jgi:virulence activator alpha
VGQLESSEAKLAHFRRIRKGMVERGVDPYRIAVLDLGIAQQRERIRWLKRMRAEIERSIETRRAA